MPSEIQNKIIELNYQGLSNKEITIKLKLKKHTVKNTNKLFRLKSNRKKSYFAISETHGKCFSCKKKILKSCFEERIYFNKNNEKDEWRDGTCKKCRYKKRQSERQNRIAKDINYYLNLKFMFCKSRSKRNKVPFTIDLKYFINQYNKQNGLCFYSDKKMINSTSLNKCAETISIDKIIPTLGYVHNNIVFCCNRINFIKNNCSINEIKDWMPDWYIRINQIISQQK